MGLNKGRSHGCVGGALEGPGWGRDGQGGGKGQRASDASVGDEEWPSDVRGAAGQHREEPGDGSLACAGLARRPGAVQRVTDRWPAGQGRGHSGGSAPGLRAELGELSGAPGLQAVVWDRWVSGRRQFARLPTGSADREEVVMRKKGIGWGDPRRTGCLSCKGGVGWDKAFTAERRLQPPGGAALHPAWHGNVPAPWSRRALNGEKDGSGQSLLQVWRDPQELACTGNRVSGGTCGLWVAGHLARGGPCELGRGGVGRRRAALPGSVRTVMEQ